MKIRKANIIKYLCMAVLCIAVLLPFLLVVGVSFSNEEDIVKSGYSFIPKHFDLSAYRFVFENPTSIFNAYKVTITFSILSMVLGVLLMSMLAFALSKRNLKFKGAMSFYVYFTMLFSGGLVPTYILISQYLRLSDTIWVYVLSGLISPWYVFMMRTFFQGIPYEITEAATVDGASEFHILSRIIYPLSTPVLATISLFVFLNKWNDWYTAMLYINKEELVSLQYLLQRIMQNIQLLQQDVNMSSYVENDLPAESVRMAMAVVVAGPALVVFPFFQKYFVSGITVGGVKG